MLSHHISCLLRYIANSKINFLDHTAEMKLSNHVLDIVHVSLCMLRPVEHLKCFHNNLMNNHIQTLILVLSKMQYLNNLDTQVLLLQIKYQLFLQRNQEYFAPPVQN